MAITTYTDLVAAVKRYCARSDSTFSAAIPDFVGLAEERLYNGHGSDDSDPLYSDPIRSAVMETDGTITVTDGVGTLPSDYLLMRRIWRDGDPLGLKYMSPERADVQNVIESAGTPVWYSVRAASISVVPSWTGDLSITYYKRFDPITSTNASGAMIETHGLAYLEATLIEAFAFLQDGELAVSHAAKLRGLVRGINRSATELRFSGPLRVRQRVNIP